MKTGIIFQADGALIHDSSKIVDLRIFTDKRQLVTVLLPFCEAKATTTTTTTTTTYTTATTTATATATTATAAASVSLTPSSYLTTAHLRYFVSSLFCYTLI
ncbi:hypothetical protein WUBG_03429 [Wuchereria bancrofti]|uniref:Uncharacterized protein n=1 Tax=Wuchereria bancrofti TaxID=6293 RepID=J9BEL4_WUCBA|nr:hypothetical protein WUBG_03429 [Wuchereria bancrofti]VDM12896.1 unnamed protein product [Wuchereria bancrofti]